MRIHPLIYIVTTGLLMLMSVACTNNKGNTKLVGVWISKKDGSKLKITAKQFTMESDAPDAEDYFVKGDTIFTSFEGNLPYTKYAIKQLGEHSLKLLTPDSTTVEFSK